MIIFYSVIASPASAPKSENAAGKKPYLQKSAKVNFTPFLLTIEENISPASAPSGVKNAPTFEPITVA